MTEITHCSLFGLHRGPIPCSVLHSIPQLYMSHERLVPNCSQHQYQLCNVQAGDNSAAAAAKHSIEEIQRREKRVRLPRYLSCRLAREQPGHPHLTNVTAAIRNGKHEGTNGCRGGSNRPRAPRCASRPYVFTNQTCGLVTIVHKSSALGMVDLSSSSSNIVDNACCLEYDFLFYVRTRCSWRGKTYIHRAILIVYGNGFGPQVFDIEFKEDECPLWEFTGDAFKQTPRDKAAGVHAHNVE